ncbi:MAG: hypothetical protein IPQ05_12485 [Leptospiraceae bacterium]|nr:hypothetical protein [Leptospiraceae bacterium]
MKKFLILVLAIAIAFSIDCKDLMNSNHIICPTKKKTIQAVKLPKCHETKKNTTKNCSCPEKKTISLPESSKLVKSSISLELVFHAPVNFIFPIQLASNMNYPQFQKEKVPVSFLNPVKTIHLLI